MDRILSARQMGADLEVAREAISNLESGKAAWVVVSGKMGSGKDSLAPLILPAMGFESSMLVGYSLPMRAELQVAIDILTGRSESYDVLAKEVAEALALKPEYALEMVELVAPHVQDPSHGLKGSTRTETWRVTLQKLGGYWRCEDDEAYWSRQVTVSCLPFLAKGKSVYLTGGRFHPDVILPQSLGARIIRLDVTPETQAKRLFKRDGFVPDEDVLNHPGEVALDDWDGFDVRVSNDGDLDEGLAAVVTGLRGLS